MSKQTNEESCLSRARQSDQVLYTLQRDRVLHIEGPIFSRRSQCSRSQPLLPVSRTFSGIRRVDAIHVLSFFDQHTPRNPDFADSHARLAVPGGGRKREWDAFDLIAAIFVVISHTYEHRLLGCNGPKVVGTQYRGAL
ncbi:hypothetical protein CXB49_17900 [Chromobacterium sp. ATCC 53434]|nr:hypothetical protein CXB49_17900 [Chromobacterium sp. ATCC 53434]